MKHKILETYRDKSTDNLVSSTLLIGIGISISGIAVGFNDTPLGICGATISAIGGFSYALSYAKAYMEAKLDYMQNKKFTKLEEMVKKTNHVPEDEIALHLKNIT